MEEYTFIVVGGGIAGVSCIERLASESITDKILLISASPIVKSVINFKQLTRNLEKFDIAEKKGLDLQEEYPNIQVLHSTVNHFEAEKRIIGVSNGSVFKYKKLCICTGGSPKLISDSPYVVGIRDTETVLSFEEKLKESRRIVVVGNGGIATELVFKVGCCEVVWAIKDSSITTTFLDPGASMFLLPNAFKNYVNRSVEEGYRKRNKFVLQEACTDTKDTLGCALGPDWLDALNAGGHISFEGDKRMHIEYNTEVLDILTHDQFKEKRLQESGIFDKNQKSHDNPKKPKITGNPDKSSEEWKVYVVLKGGKVVGCDLVVSATGVTPNIHPFARLSSQLVVNQSDGGIEVDSRMMTSVEDVFAAGDVCTAAWSLSPYWIQMRLWTQARQMGVQAADSMLASVHGGVFPDDFTFELFAHVTNFFNYKVILLGRFNGQNLGNDYKMLVKVVEGEQYIKVILKDGKLVGATLVGETDLEETFENLILNQLDLSIYGDELLEQHIDDFFD